MYNDGVITTEFTGSVVSGTYIYPSAEQNAVIKFNDFYLSGRDGDFTTDGISIQYMTGESEDLTIGNAPSAVINATMMNPDGAMDRLTWGYGTAYIGVVTASAQADKYSSWPCYVNVNGTRFGIYNSRMYRGTSYSALTGEPVAVIVTSDGKATYITDTKIGYYNGSSFSTVADPSPAQAYLAAKCRRYVNPLGIGLDANGCPAVFNDVSGGTKKTFTYIPMGVYDFSGVDAYGIAFCAEAYDKMTLFDADATDWLQTLDFSTPMTLSAFIAELMTEMGMSYTISVSAVNTGVPLTVNPVTSYSVTYRQILKWLAQAIGCNARMSRTGAVEFVTYSATPVGNAIRPDTIVSGGRTKTRYTIPGINQVICYNTVGAGFEYHDPQLPPDTEMVPLYIIANPFVDPSASMEPVEDLCGLVDDIPGYYPTTLNVVCSDPRIDAGDFVTVYNTDSATTYNIPVMTQTIYWSNACRTQYIATGNQVRQIPDAITDCADLSGVVSSNPTAVVNAIMTKGITVYDSDDNVLFNAVGDDHLVEIAGFEVDNTSLHKTTESSADVFDTVHVGIDKIESEKVDLSDGFAVSNIATMQNGWVQVYENNPDPDGNHVYYTNINPDYIFFHKNDGGTILQADYSAEEASLRSTYDSNEASVTKDRVEVTNGTNTVTHTATGVTADNGTASTTLSAAGLAFDDGSGNTVPKLSVIRRQRATSGTTPITLSNGVYLATVTHQNNTVASQSGLYIVQIQSNSSVLPIAAAGNCTLEINANNAHQLDWTVTNTYRELFLFKLST